MKFLVASALGIGIQVMVQGQLVVFSDVPENAWFAAYVRQSAEVGIVSGYKDTQGNLTGRYGPANNVTLAEALKIAVEGAGYDEAAYGSVVESGVQHWSSTYVSVAKGEKFDVFHNRQFSLDAPATRAQVASVFASAFHVDTERVNADAFSDVRAETEYAQPIGALQRDAVVSGDTDAQGNLTGMFRPHAFINRAEMAKMIVKAREIYGTPGAGREPPEVVREEQYEVVYSNTGFFPKELTVPRGATVTFRNTSNVLLWIASDPHPVHTALPLFDVGQGLTKGEIYTFTFLKADTWGFHNHLQAQHKGAIIVE